MMPNVWSKPENPAELEMLRKRRIRRKAKDASLAIADEIEQRHLLGLWLDGVQTQLDGGTLTPQQLTRIQTARDTLADIRGIRAAMRAAIQDGTPAADFNP